MTDHTHEPLDADESNRLESSRAWVKGHFTDGAEEKYESISGKLRIVDAVLKNGWVDPTETWKLQSLGVALGDALAQELMLDWVLVDDELGRSPALNWPGTSVYSFPTTMISKRVERGEAVDVYELFNSARDNLRDMSFSGRYL